MTLLLQPVTTVASESAQRRRWPFEFGSFGSLLIRRESLTLGLPRPTRILYASDLHLGHWWTRPVPGQLLAAVRETQPETILLGGDLLDHAGALPALRELVRALSGLAPVYAIPGNHDARAGFDAVRCAILDAGGQWLPDGPIAGPLRIDGTIAPGAVGEPRLLCTHYPRVFPEAVVAGYRLVLAGHLHGGQCVLYTHRNQLYPAVWFHRWHGLQFVVGAATMLVSRGLGDTLPVRFNCPREVLLCELT
jgi:predicted MPP superfamily phosphohydrolase